MTTSAPVSADLLPGYFLDPVGSGAWMTLPWPGDPSVGWLERPDPLPPSIAYQAIWWAQHTLVNHLSGAPWRFYAWQKRFLVLWYALRDGARVPEFGESDPVPYWLYTSGAVRRAKGVGKDPFLGVSSLIELAGPCRWTGEYAAGGEVAEWSVDLADQYIFQPGEPIAEPLRLPLVQIAANSEAQAADVLRVANAMVPAETADLYGFDKGTLRTQLASGGRIELLTNSERSAEGDPATAEFLNESHHMTESSGGQALAKVARRNAGKSPGGLARVCEFTNAHEEGAGSVAEGTYLEWQNQVKRGRSSLLYDSHEAPPHLRIHIEEERRLGIAAAYSESPHSSRARIEDEILDTRTPVADSIRYYFNALATNEEAWIAPRDWDKRARSDQSISDGEKVTAFLDCSKSGDATTLVIVRLSDGFTSAGGGWQRPHGDRGKGWLAPRDDVDAAVHRMFARYKVQWFGVDPSPARDDETEALYWAPLIDEWHREFKDQLPLWATPGQVKGHAVKFDMRMSQPGGRERVRIFTEQAMQVAESVEADLDEGFFHDGDPMMRVHVHNARNRRNDFGTSLSKKNRDSSELVDYAVTMVGAHLGRRLVLNAGISDDTDSTGELW